MLRRGPLVFGETTCGFIAAICMAMSCASCRKSSVFATKSVSQFTSTSTPMRPPAWMYDSTTPWLGLALGALGGGGDALLAEDALAFFDVAAASSSARFASMTPAPVASRSSLISSVVISPRVVSTPRVGVGAAFGRCGLLLRR